MAITAYRPTRAGLPSMAGLFLAVAAINIIPNPSRVNRALYRPMILRTRDILRNGQMDKKGQHNGIYHGHQQLPCIYFYEGARQ